MSGGRVPVASGPRSTALLPLAGLLATACADPGVGRLPAGVVGLCDRGAPDGTLAIEVERDGTLRDTTIDVPIEALPPAVREAALATGAGTDIVSARRGTGAWGTEWTVRMHREGRAVELLLEDRGRLLELRRELRSDEVPSMVLAAADRAEPEGKVVRVDLVQRGNATEYRVAREAAGGDFVVVLTSDGSPLRVLRRVRTDLLIPLPPR